MNGTFPFNQLILREFIPIWRFYRKR